MSKQGSPDEVKRNPGYGTTKLLISCKEEGFGVKLKININKAVN